MRACVCMRACVQCARAVCVCARMTLCTCCNVLATRRVRACMGYAATACRLPHMRADTWPQRSAQLRTRPTSRLDPRARAGGAASAVARTGGLRAARHYGASAHESVCLHGRDSCGQGLSPRVHTADVTGESFWAQTLSRTEPLNITAAAVMSQCLCTACDNMPDAMLVSS